MKNARSGLAGPRERRGCPREYPDSHEEVQADFGGDGAYFIQLAPLVPSSSAAHGTIFSAAKACAVLRSKSMSDRPKSRLTVHTGVIAGSSSRWVGRMHRPTFYIQTYVFFSSCLNIKQRDCTKGEKNIQTLVRN